MLDNLYNIWNSVWDFLTHVSFGSVLTYMSIGASIFFGLDRWLLSHRKPKAELRFANGKREVTLCPHYILKSPKIKYYMYSNTDVRDYKKYNDIITNYTDEHRNEKFLSLAFRLSNTGRLQLEDYSIEIDRGNGISHIFKPINLLTIISKDENEPTNLNIDPRRKPNVVYAPVDNRPLNQKDHRDFEFHICPDTEADKAELLWRIIAKDFYKEGKFVIRLKPKITEFDDIQLVYNEEQIPEGAEKIEDLTPYIEKLKKKLEEN